MANIISPNGLFISGKWILVPKKGFRLIALEGGKNLTPKINSRIRLVELTDSSKNKNQKTKKPKTN